MQEDFWVETESGTLEELVERAQEAFAFIVKHGGIPSRWRSFSMITDVFLVELASIKFLGDSHFPCLTSIAMTFTGPDEHDDEDEFTLSEHIYSRPKLLFLEPPPKLRSIKLEGIPGPYLFGHLNHPQIVGLTCLELRFEGIYPHLVDLNKMLNANPNLQTLRLGSETTFEPAEVDRKQFPRVHLPKLQSLSFIDVASPLWTLHAITMLDVPNTTSFELTLGMTFLGDDHEEAGVRKLMDHIICDASQATLSPRFPSLRSLTLPSDMQLTFGYDIEQVLAAYPRLKELTLPKCESLAPLLKRPWLSPDIERLRVGVKNLVQLKKVVNSRCKAGLPLRTVLVDDFDLRVRVKQSDRAQLEKYVDFALVLPDGERLDGRYWVSYETLANFG
ncbi:hypothetical protein BN14_07274 [Rhizoctonia solani AG-1 IB]|uniref:F-box domain-containing protein n=1 Tax=Thanatephorus cucumeris (strain AG1-IB / isolate 7/3/14) TaxID=1108050 RepID=M5C164_THACB|nr:hypothetical protein BN14_07274 [Rhizoctonia solani AG-1 IB]